MQLKKLNIWDKCPHPPWVRNATDRWAELLMRGSFIFLSLFDASPLPRAEMEILMLLLIEEGERSEPAILAKRLNVSRQSMTGLLDKLENAGHIERLDHPTDRRRKIVHLTESGRAIVSDIGRKALRRDANLISTIEQKKMEHMLDLMEGLCSRIEDWDREHPL